MNIEILEYIIVIIIIILCIAILTLIERKIMGKIQRRVGPNINGWNGILQPFLDGAKLVLKENIIPYYSSKYIYVISPILTLFLCLCFWVVLPFGKNIIMVDLNLSIMYIIMVSGLGVYGIICSGWSSNSKYAFLGALRSAAQMISYEVSIGIIILNVVLCSQDYSLIVVIEMQQLIWNIFPLFPLFLLFLFSILAETNRAPFDLPEAEAELVSGYNIEYGAMGFALFFIGEYGNIIFMSLLTVILFLGGYNLFCVINIIVYYLKLNIFLEIL